MKLEHGGAASEGVLHDRVVLADGSHPIKTKSSNRRGKGGGCAREVQEKSVFGRRRVGGRSRGVGPLNRSRVHDTRSGMTRVGWNAKSSAQRNARGNK